MIKKILYVITAIILAYAGKLLLQSDYVPFLQWWVTIAIIGVIFLPLTTLIFGCFHDKGYLFSKTIGIAISGYIIWLISSLHIMKFTETACIIAVVISLIFNVIILFLRRRNRANNVTDDNNSFVFMKDKSIDAMISEELLFFGLFLLFTYIRGFKPEAYGTEKFMDFGFMTSMMRSEYMPPQDFWFSGTKLNYYYVGQYLATFLTKLSFVKVSSGYNLMLMMVGAFAFVLPYSLGYNIMSQFIKDQGKKGRGLPRLSGFVAGAGVCIAGNMHYPTYQWFENLVRKFFGIEPNTVDYWFPDATRFIGYHPETTDKTIHEFPAYSFVLGDLHAHVINILFVLTVLGILFAWLCTRKTVDETKASIIKETFHPAIILIAFFIGLFHATNFWDFPIYFVVSGGIILFSNLVVYNFKGKAFGVTGLQGIFVIIFSEIIALPFTLNFDQISTNICLVVAHTPLNQMIILWGLPIFTVLSFLCFVIANFVRNRKEIQQKIQQKIQQEMQQEMQQEIKQEVIQEVKQEIQQDIKQEIKQEIQQDIKQEMQQQKQEKQKPWVIHFFGTLSASDLFIIIIGLCAIGLIIIPEIVYVEDIYSGDYKRANTMFKLTYQAFIMFGVCFGYIFLRLLCFGKTLRQKGYAGTGFILFVLTLFYAQNAVNSWYGNIFDRKGYEGLDATTFMETEMPDDNLAIDWLNENIKGIQIVLEANGEESYTDYQRVSVMTGLPTVLGWRTHEWLWRSDATLIDERAADIQLIYTSTNETEVKKLLDKYQVDYIYVGKLEEEKFEDINHNLLKSLGDLVFMSPVTSVKEYETYIIQIKY